MSQAPASSGLVRVTVASSTRRVDLVLPGAVPVAELVPELARSVGLLDAATVHGGYRVVTQDGRALTGDAGLTLQGIEDGQLLTVSAGADELLPRVYDDVAEALAEVVERDHGSWEPASVRRTALAAAGVLLALAAGAFLLLRDQPAGWAGAGVSLALLVAAVVLSRTRPDAEAAVAAGWLATAFAAVAGAALAPAGDGPGLPLAGAAAGALGVGLLALVGVADGRPLLLPPVVLGALLLPVGLLLEPADLDLPVVLTTGLVAVVIASSLLSWLALATVGAGAELAFDAAPGPEGLDVERLAADARLAHQVLLALSGTVGLLLVLVAPLAVSLGVGGTLVAVVAALVVMLRTRQYRAGSEVRTGLVSGVLGLAAVAVSVVVLHPGWRPAAAVVLTVAGAAVLLAAVLPPVGAVARRRLADGAEAVALLSLLPLLAVASRLVPAVVG